MSNFEAHQWIFTAFGWAILHSIWQIALIGALWFMLNLGIKKVSPTTNYLLSILALFAIVIMAGTTLFSTLKVAYTFDNQLLSSESVVQITADEKAVDFSAPVQNGSKSELQETSLNFLGEVQSREWLSPNVLKYLVMLWLFGVLFLGIRFIVHWMGMQRLAHKGVSPFKEVQLSIFNKLKNNIGIKKSITFLQSSLVASPMTFGHFKPIILLPLGMINGFPPTHIEAILLHELAHIRRNDFLINVMQTWLEILFFYHPIVWIISKRIRTIREELCDDEVIRMMSGAKGTTSIPDQNILSAKIHYAESLLNLQKYFLHNKKQLAMNAKSNKNELTHRIHRLFQPNQHLSSPKKSIKAYLFGLVMLIAVASFAFSKISNPTVSIAVDKMNVLYVGIGNPITVAVAGIPAEDTKVESEQLNIQDQGNGHYIVKAKTPGKAIIKVNADGHATQEIEFRVKTIPDPIARIGNSHGGTMNAEKIIKSEGIDAMLDCFEYDTQCAITGYTMTYVAKSKDPIESINRSENHSEKTKELLQQAKPGDIYYFDNVLCRCPGDQSERPINSMVFRIR